MSRSICSSRPPWWLLIFTAGGTLDLGGSARAREKGGGGERNGRRRREGRTRGGEEGGGPKVWKVARDGGYIIASLEASSEEARRGGKPNGRTDGPGGALARRGALVLNWSSWTMAVGNVVSPIAMRWMEILAQLAAVFNGPRLSLHGPMCYPLEKF